MITVHFLLALIVLFVLDAATTVYILKRGGEELNGPLAWLMGEIGVKEALIVVKVVAFGAIAYVAEGVPNGVRIAILGGYVLLVGWNLYQVFELKREQS
jgi:hypothetical protein